MISFFSEQGLARLEQLLEPGTLCAFDFDGTLAPIVAQHEDACLPTDILEQLLHLSKCASVAIITGRSIADIRPRLRFEPHFIIGNHGIEGLPGWAERTESYETICKEWIMDLRGLLADHDIFDQAIALENKRYSISVHYRGVKNEEETENALMHIFNRLRPAPRIVSGKCVFNLLPADAADKGSALEQLIRMTDAPSAIYVGDDITDEDVFRLHRKDVLSVRVEHELTSAAEFFIKDRIEISRLLEELIRRCHQMCRT
jgi:trehalose 6-phosphate phosphatase